ncbi:MAG TPA: acyltransferase [Allosphingosinicella sp.]
MTVEAISARSGRIRDLDALRGLAALAVVLFHFTTRYQAVYGHRTEPWLNVPWGHYGVQLFFGISGFVIFMTLDRTRSLSDFAVSRASRLFPAYWTAILITTLVVTFAGMKEFVRTPLEIAINTTMLQTFVNVRPVDGVYWTLSVELAFYCIMAALWKLRLLPRIEPVLFAWMGLEWIWAFSPKLIGFEPSWLLGALLIQDYIPFFAIGIAAYRMKCEPGRRGWAWAVMAAALLTVAVCDGWAHLIVALISTAALTAIALRGVPLLGARPLVWLGAISYSLYLLHELIGFALIRWLESAGISATAAIGLTTAAMLALAAAATFLVERPALRAIRGAYRTWQERTSLRAQAVAAE